MFANSDKEKKVEKPKEAPKAEAPKKSPRDKHRGR